LKKTSEVAMMELKDYALTDASAVDSPALLYYPETIRRNIQKAIEIAGGADHLWPHVKTHKLTQVVDMQRQAGIRRFKCATVAEAEMLGSMGIEHVMLAYPLIGPSVARFMRLLDKFPQTTWWVCVDGLAAVEQLNRQAGKTGLRLNVLVDVNTGMDRTGIGIDKLEEFYVKAAGYENIQLRGFHCYDGHIKDHNPVQRRVNTDIVINKIIKIRHSLQNRGYNLDTMIMGGTPTFPCHAERISGRRACEGVYLSPGTLFIHDYGYWQRYPDLPFIPAAALLTRVISRPASGLFTLDAGSKAVGSDPKGIRGVILSLQHAESVSQSEEHWVFGLDESDPGFPEVGDVLYVIPTHICTTAALYEEAFAVRNGVIDETWRPAARTRRISI